MALAHTRSVTLVGVAGVVVDVEAYLGNGLPGFTIVGLPDAALHESRDRVRAAVVNSGERWPQRRITVGLSPASVPKRGSQFDLGVATAIVAASGAVPHDQLADLVLLGELSLDGQVRRVPGVLPAMLSAAAAGVRRAVVPRDNRAEAELVPDISVLAVDSLGELLAVLRGEPAPSSPGPEPVAAGIPAPAASLPATVMMPGAGTFGAERTGLETRGSDAPAGSGHARAHSGPGTGGLGTGDFGPDGVGLAGARPARSGAGQTGSAGGEAAGTSAVSAVAVEPAPPRPAGVAPAERGEEERGHPGAGPPRLDQRGEDQRGEDQRREDAGDPGWPDLADVCGQAAGRRALEICAAGGHHLFLYGAPGAGKTMLAERLPGLLPPLDLDTALEVTAVHSVAGLLPAERPLVTAAPFCAPHHTASLAALVGGGSRVLRPGAVSLAHRGVLFIDEAPEFGKGVLDALRQPLEAGEITVTRLSASVRFPARFQLVLGANPCPCGLAVGKGLHCRCSPFTRRRYLGRLSGPLLDRIDLRVEVLPTSRAELFAEASWPESTAVVAQRVLAARERASRRLSGTPWRTNAEIPGRELRRRWRLPPAALRPALGAMDRGLLTARGVDRVLRVSWTVADLHGHDQPTVDDVVAALRYRCGPGESGPSW